MPYHHADQFNNQIKRKCECGGDPEMLIDFIDDFIVRCKKCHKATWAYIEPEDAIEHWDELWDQDDENRPPLELLIDDLEKSLAGEVAYMAIAQEDADQINRQSCDCFEVVIVMRDRILLAEHEHHGEDGAIGFDKISNFNENRYGLRVVAPPNGIFKFVKVLYSEDGSVDGIKYLFGDHYVFIFASEYNLIVTKSVVDLFEEDDTPIPVSDPSILFDGR